jgi:hypothetical protein
LPTPVSPEQQNADVGERRTLDETIDVLHRLVEDDELAPVTLPGRRRRVFAGRVLLPRRRPAERRVGDHHPAAADLDDLAGRDGRRLIRHEARAADSRSVRAAQILDAHDEGDVQARVQPRHRRVLDADRRIGCASQRQCALFGEHVRGDVLAGADHQPARRRPPAIGPPVRRDDGAVDQ